MLIVIVCAVAGIPIAVIAGNAQIQWLEAIEERLAETTKWLHNMKLLKMTGLIEKSSSTVTNSRTSEIAASRRYRVCSIFLVLGGD